jgi:hypothetical protein
MVKLRNVKWAGHAGIMCGTSCRKVQVEKLCNKGPLGRTHRLGSLACYDSEFKDPFRHFGRILRTGEWSITKPLPIKDSTTHKTVQPQAGFKTMLPVAYLKVYLVTDYRAW